MTKGEIQAYTIIRLTLARLISQVVSYCREYNCGSELLRECKEAEEQLKEASVLFNKGRRKK